MRKNKIFFRCIQITYSTIVEICVKFYQNRRLSSAIFLFLSAYSEWNSFLEDNSEQCELKNGVD